jgi:HTH-type transcriptional regulator, transcriptional repressor of NAD biosynthesis genes
MAERTHGAAADARINNPMIDDKNPERRFGLGLVVGKFSPLHLGHEWLIQQAAMQCNHLLILSYANPEFDRCDASTRRRWFAARFPEHETLVIDATWPEQTCARRGIAVRPLPLNDSNDEEQQNFLAWLLKDVLKRIPDAIFCNEPYGPSCASGLTKALGYEVAAVIMDLDRNQFGISATQIRQTPFKQRRWMSPDVAGAFVHRIVLLGGESSGKSTLAAALAAHYKTVWVHEYGRELWERQNGVMSEEDLLKIGHEQIRREEEALRSANRYLLRHLSTHNVRLQLVDVWTHRSGARKSRYPRIRRRHSLQTRLSFCTRRIST